MGTTTTHMPRRLPHLGSHQPLEMTMTTTLQRRTRVVTTMYEVAFTLAGFGRNDLAEQIEHVANQIANGDLTNYDQDAAAAWAFRGIDEDTPL